MVQVETVHFHFRGRVQGVWFRKTSQQIAQRVGVVGFVRNLADGSVEAVAQGTSAAIQEFFSAVAEHYRGQIAETEVNPWTGAEVFTGFEVR
jgi:acylphosphatase